MAAFDDVTLRKIAEEIGDNSNLMDLGLKLGFKESKMTMYIKTNNANGEVGFRGTSNMLFDWKKRTRAAQQMAMLKKALEDSNLASLLDDPDLFHQEQEGSSSTGTSQPASQATNRPIDQGDTGGTVSDDYLNEIVDDFPNDIFSKICKSLGWTENQAQNKLASNCNDYTKTYRSALQSWKNKTAGTKQELVQLLAQAGYKMG